MMETKRAQQVCVACKRRKKGCDKALPACSFCKARKLTCRYDIALPKISNTATGRITGTNWVVIPFSPPPDSQAGYETRSSPILTGCSSPLWCQSIADSLLSIDELLNQQVSSIIELVNLTLDEISERYFQTPHKRLPIVAPELFRRRLANRGAEVPPADFSVLLLAIILITIPPETDAMWPLVDRKSLYTTTRSLLFQVQTVVCTSTSLIQAALLIAVCEYACGLPEAAYISMGTCTSMARMLGIRELPTPQDRIHVDVNTKLKDLEQSNLLWGIAMVERVILCEIDQKDLRPLTEYPNQESRLPSDIEPADLLEAGQAELEPSKPATLATLSATNVSNFGRQAQAVSLLDQVLYTVRSAASIKSTISEFRQLDGKIQDFLVLLLNEDIGKDTTSCAAIAVTVRSLFLLHWTVLEHVQMRQTEAENQLRQNSWAALGTACKIVVDVSKSHMKYNMNIEADKMPICCYYNIRASMHYLQERDKRHGAEELSRDFCYLLASKKKFLKRWMLRETSSHDDDISIS